MIDMRSYIPAGTDEATLRSWYHGNCYMYEKWSDLGHRAYARMVAALVLARKNSSAPERASR